MTDYNTIYLKTKDYPMLSKRIDRWIVSSLNIHNTLNQEHVFNQSIISRSKIKNLIKNGFVSLDKNVVRDPAFTLKNEKEITIRFPKLIDAIPKPEKLSLDITFEDKDILIINKQPGLVVHPAPGHETGTLVNGILYHCNDDLSGIGGVKRPGIVHRLDKDTSGLMIVAKTEIAHITLVKMFQKHNLERIYKALVWNVPKSSGLIDAPIGRSKINRKKMAVIENGRNAITKWKIKRHFCNVISEIECKLETGRTHQIRVHMSYIGHSLVGDKIYGLKRSISKQTSKDQKHNILQGTLFPRQALHSSRICFNHPITNKKMHFTSDFPNDMKDLIKTLIS